MGMVQVEPLFSIEPLFASKYSLSEEVLVVEYLDFSPSQMACLQLVFGLSHLPQRRKQYPCL